MVMINGVSRISQMEMPGMGKPSLADPRPNAPPQQKKYASGDNNDDDDRDNT